MTIEDFEKAGIVMAPLYIREGEKLYTIYIKDKEDETNE